MRKFVFFLLFVYSAASYSAVEFRFSNGDPLVAAQGFTPDALCSSEVSNNVKFQSYTYNPSGGGQYGSCSFYFTSSWAWAYNNPSTYFVASTTISTCPSGYQVDSSGYCVLAPVCPYPGTVTLTLITPAEDDSGVVNYNGCSYEYNNNDKKFHCWVVVSTNKSYCAGSYTSSAFPLPNTIDLGTLTFPPEDTNMDSTASTSDTVNQSGTPSTAPDGTTTKTDTVTKTDVTDTGTVINDSPNTITITDSNGTVTTYTDSTTTVTHPDGTKSVTKNTATTVASPTVNNTVIDKSSGNSSSSTVNSTVNNYNSTVVTNYDSAGNQTGQSQTSTGDSTAGQAQNSGGKDGTCDPLIQDCGGSAKYTGKPHDALYTKTTKTFQSVISKFKDDMAATTLISSASGFFDTNISGSCPVWVIPSVWVFGSITIDAQCSPMMTDIFPLIAAIMIATAGFIAFRWAVL